MSRNIVTIDLPSYSLHTRYARPQANAHCFDRLIALVRGMDVLLHWQRRIGVGSRLSCVALSMEAIFCT